LITSVLSWGLLAISPTDEPVNNTECSFIPEIGNVLEQISVETLEKTDEEKPMSYEEYIGAPMSAHTIHVERGSVSRFADACSDKNPVYHDLKAAKAAGFDAPPVPPTWTFASAFLGAYTEDQPQDPTGGKGNPMMKLMIPPTTAPIMPRISAS